MTKALVPLAEGCEEMEAVILLDVFRRAGWDVLAAGLKEGPVRASRGVVLMPDLLLDDVDLASVDVLALPGGAGGMENLRADARVLQAVRDVHAGGKLVCAVCAAPAVLHRAGIINGVRVTCHPSARDEIAGADVVDEQVVVSGNIVTSQGPGTTFAFALTIIRIMDGDEKAAALTRSMVL